MSVVAVRELGLDADEAAGNMAAIEYPVHGISAEDVAIFSSAGSRSGSIAGVRRGPQGALGSPNGDGARRARLQRMLRAAAASDWQSLARSEPRVTKDGDGWFHG